jgi:multiple sugar transport system ATP-binding protein
MAEIACEEVTKVYPDGTEAVRAVDLEIPDGSLMVLVGPSGCGKTTLLRMVAGLEEITDGTIRIGGRVINEVAAKNRDVAMVFQNYALYPHMSVFENMAFGLKLRRLPKREIRERVRAAARTLGLEDQLRKKPGALSGGQRQRVAMGRAIVREPQAFLMDEPLSNLDAKLRVQMRVEISRIQRNLGTTMMYVTHDQTEAMTMGDQVAVMKRGELQQVDTPQELYDHPANLFVAGFIGSPAMNMVEATIRRGDGVLYAEFGGFRLRVPDERAHSAPRLVEYADRTVVLGIRPEDIDDPALVSAGAEDSTLPVTVDLREAMGSEVFVHFNVNAPPVLTEDTRELAADAGEEGLLQLSQLGQDGETTSFIARMSPRTGAREGQPMQVYVDTRGLHFFDLETGEAIS